MRHGPTELGPEEGHDDLQRAGPPFFFFFFFFSLSFSSSSSLFVCLFNSNIGPSYISFGHDDCREISMDSSSVEIKVILSGIRYYFSSALWSSITKGIIIVIEKSIFYGFPS